jgi:hypothetical protein
MTDPSAAAAYERALAVAGQTATFYRVTGQPPTAVKSPSGGATVTAVVRKIIPDASQAGAAGYSASQLGGVSQTDREILVMASDLSAAGFPLPVKKNDVVEIGPGDRVVVVEVDAYTRAIAGCIVLSVAGVA